MNTAWEDVKEKIKGKLSEKSFSLWIDPLNMVEKKNDTLILGCPNKFSRNWITENYMGLMEDILAKSENGTLKLALEIDAPAKKKPTDNASNDSRQLTLPHLPKHDRRVKNGLNNNFTFDNFVVGRCNEFAYSASKALAMGDNWPYKSLFILANTGLGKSHLSQAIGNALRENSPEIRVCYVTAEDFINQMIFSLKNHRIDEFKNKFRRSCDVLLLEEIHFLSGKEKTQLELEYTLDVLSNDNKKIIFTSSLLPKNIPNLKKGLSSRLTSGIITTLEKPDYQTRCKIIERKSLEQKLDLSEEIIDLLAKQLTGDVRQMESALRCCKAKSELLKAKITTDLALEAVRCHVSDQNAITLEDIKLLVCKYFKIDPFLVGSKSRKKIHSYPRSIFIYLCRHFSDATSQDIGRAINRNHSTVLHASEVIEKKIRIDTKVKNQVEFLTGKLKESIK